MEKKTIFLHIPKAAGSSILKFLTSQIEPSKCKLHLELDPSALNDESAFKSISLIEGHIPFYHFKNKLNLSNYYLATSIREPLSHLISHIAFIRKMAEPDQKDRYAKASTFTKELANTLAKIDFTAPNCLSSLNSEQLKFFDNCQVNYLRDQNSKKIGYQDLIGAIKTLDRFDAIGITENIEYFFRKLSHNLGIKWNGDIPRENVQSEKYGMSADNHAFVSAIQPLIRYDNILYEYALEKQKEQLSIHGNIGQVTSEKIIGWCAYKDKTFPARVSISINNIKIGSVEANKLRADIKNNGSHTTGICGFNYIFEPENRPKVGDIVHVQSDFDNMDLKQSPFRIKQ